MFFEPVQVLLRPIYLMLLSTFFIPLTVIRLIKTQNLTPFTSFSSFKDHWFARFWGYFGPASRDMVAPGLIPLMSNATGTVLEIGPGQGHFLTMYKDLPNRAKITKVYAVEPNREHHAALRENARLGGIDGIFEILDSTVEDLESKAGVQRASVDTIVTLMVLCSVYEQERVIRELRTYLKPKVGRWIVVEHVRRWDNGGVALYQALLNWIWPTFFNGCNLNRDTAVRIMGTGGWDLEKSDGGLKQAPKDSPWTALPTMMGVLFSE